MKVKEAFVEKSFELDSKNPYDSSIKIIDELGSFGFVKIKENVFETDGPEKRCRLKAVLVKRFDKFSKIIGKIEINGQFKENNTGKIFIYMEFSLVMNIEDYGIFSEAFSEYYIRNFFSNIRSNAMEDAKNIARQMEQKSRKIAA